MLEVQPLDGLAFDVPGGPPCQPQTGMVGQGGHRGTTHHGSRDLVADDLNGAPAEL